jgi:large subunit ribosomal protein L24
MSTSLKSRLETIGSAPKHIRDKSICSTLTDDLREQYNRRSIRVIKGDTVRVMRGEYTGIEGKVEKVNTRRGTLSIEGVQREKVRGGNVKVQIHSSNVRVSGLNLDDKYRQNKIRGENQQRETEKQDIQANTNTDQKNKKKRRINNTTKKVQLFKNRSKKKNTKKNSVNENENERTPNYTQGKESNKKNSSADNSRTTNQSKEGKRG